jgi:outer membrane protein
MRRMRQPGWRVGVAAIALWTGAVSVRAQERLTLEGCLAGAAENNQGLAAAQEAVQKAVYDHKASKSDYYPQLSADASQSKSGRKLDSAGSTESDNTSVGISARQTIYAGGKNRASVEQAAAARESAEIELRSTRAQLTYDVRGAFGDLLYAQELIALTEAIAKRRGDNVDFLDLRYEGGKEHKGSLLYMQATYSQAEFEVAQAKRALRVAQRKLARVLGRSEVELITARGVLDAATPGPAPDLDALALETLDHQRTLNQQRAAQAGVALARSQYYPEVSVRGDAAKGGEDWSIEEDSWSAGVYLSFPFFTGGRNYMDVQSAKAEQRRVEASARDTDEQVRLDLEQALISYENAVERVAVQARYVKAAEVRADIARSQYASGMLGFDNWDLIENDLISQQKILLANRRDAVIAEAQWDKVCGRSRLPE